MGDVYQVINAYFEALVSDDLGSVPWADDVKLWAPLGPEGLNKPISGAPAVRKFLSSVTPLIIRVNVQNIIVDGEWGVGRAFISLSNPAEAVLRVADVFRIKNGRILFQENHFDPRPVLVET